MLSIPPSGKGLTFKALDESWMLGNFFEKGAPCISGHRLDTNGTSMEHERDTGKTMYTIPNITLIYYKP